MPTLLWLAIAALLSAPAGGETMASAIERLGIIGTEVLDRCPDEAGSKRRPLCCKK